MIQRKQTLFLVAGLIGLALLFTPAASFVTIDNAGNSEKMASPALLADGMFNITDHIILMLLASAGILLSVIAIFSFKNRSFQIRICRFIIIDMCLMIVFAGWVFYKNFQDFPADIGIDLQFGTLFPPGVIILIILALKFIRRDEKLLRSVDRLR